MAGRADLRCRLGGRDAVLSRQSPLNHAVAYPADDQSYCLDYITPQIKRLWTLSTCSCRG